MKPRLLVQWGAVLLALGFLACSYEALSVAETDVVLTIKDGDRDYTQYKTYALADEVVDLCGTIDPDLGLDPLPLGGAGGGGGRSGFDSEDCFDLEDQHEFDAVILEQIATNMDALGYERVATIDDNPDVVVLVGAVARDNWQYQPAYPWCDPYYYYYCWYPSTGYVYNLPTAAILINMVDVSESATDDLKSVWFAALQGLFQSSSEVSTETRIKTSIDNAFAQSPYLDLGSSP